MTAKAHLINDNGMKLNRYCLTEDKVVNCSFYTGTKRGLFQSVLPILEINQTSNTSTEGSVHADSPCVTTQTNVLAI
jgi:hypothetical protein